MKIFEKLVQVIQKMNKDLSKWLKVSFKKMLLKKGTILQLKQYLPEHWDWVENQDSNDVEK
jgi:hypothetical protein